ncbi:hypothetical protein K438DRAFT_1525181, partial [Mycena galopus ATCC 62051]
RVYFGADDIVNHFEKPTTNIPSIDSLWTSARILVCRYSSQQVYNLALSKNLSDSAAESMQVPCGSPWTPPVEPSQSASEGKTKKKKKANIKHVEEVDFTGDQVLVNEILFLQDMGWWNIAARAVPDGEIGRVWEIMKIWIFNFSGSSNHNYANYLLETYCLHQYEASKEFSLAMLNNWLVNPTGYKWNKCDYAQEGNNKWLEEMVNHKGDELHRFRPGHTNGHATVNFFQKGFKELEEGKIANFIQQSTAYADVTADV